MSLPDATTVLIVGAGPAGLVTALSLIHHGFNDFVVVDALARGQNTSRAGVVHAATLEALDTIGCVDDVASQGIKTTAFVVGSRSAKLIGAHIDSLKPHTRHPYVLIIPQSVTERTLEKKLTSFGVTIHRPLRVVGLKRNAENPQLTDATFEDGRMITAKYVIGADGARSVVRTTAGIGFSDPTFVEGEYENNLTQMVIADVTFDTTNTDELMSGITLSQKSLFLCFPLPSSQNECLAADGKVVADKIYRIACGVPVVQGEIPHAPSKEYLQTLVDRFAPYRLSSDPTVNPNHKPTSIKDVVWSSRFRNHASIADTTFTRLGGAGEPGDGGVVFLIGDAAHIHSPAGGQGMNLGIRDGIFLGEALTKHFRATETGSPAEADAVLREFAATRHARALEVIKFTKEILSVTGMKYQQKVSWWFPVDSATVRAWVMWVLGCIPFFQRKMAWELSGLGRR